VTYDTSSQVDEGSHSLISLGHRDPFSPPPRTYDCRCDERLISKAEVSTRLTYTGFRGGLELLKIETSLIDERFESVIVYFESRK
jgi:hypothetical protein